LDTNFEYIATAVDLIRKGFAVSAYMECCVVMVVENSLPRWEPRERIGVVAVTWNSAGSTWAEGVVANSMDKRVEVYT